MNPNCFWRATGKCIGSSSVHSLYSKMFELVENTLYAYADDGCLCGHLLNCCFVASMHLFSQSLSIALRCGGLLQNVIFNFSSAWCIWWPGFALIRLSCRCVIDVMLLQCVCCTKLIQTRITVCSVSSHLLLSEFDIPELRLHIITSIGVESIKM